MTTESLTCPYCNASIGVTPGLSAGQRIACPRCGDTFPLRPAEAFTSQPTSSAATKTAITNKPATTASPVPSPELSLPSRRSPGLVAALVVGVMLFMAGGGLIFMLKTQPQRRAYDTSRPPRRPGRERGVPLPEFVPPTVASISPDKLPALGYLPSNVNCLFAVRVPELLASPAGAQIVQTPIKLGNKNHGLEELPGWLGFRLEDIDHLVFAAGIDDTFPPPFYLIFRTAKPYDEESMRERLKGTRSASAGKKTVYKFHLKRPDLDLHAWFADERTVVLALFPDQLQRLPSEPVEDLRQLPEEVRTVLKQRAELAAPVWIVGHSHDWNKTRAAIFLHFLKKQDRAKLAALRTFGIWLVPDNSLVIKGVFDCQDKTGAQGLEDYFRSLRDEPDANFKTALDGRWLTVQFPTSPDFLSQLLKR